MSLAQISRFDHARSIVPVPVSIPPHDEEKLRGFETQLRRSGHRELAQVRVRVREGSVILEGCVGSFHSKQLAQEAIRPLAAGMRINNELRVK